MSQGFDMSAASLVEALGPLASGQPAEPYEATAALRPRHHIELLAEVRRFLDEIGVPGTVGVGDIHAYFEVKRQTPATARTGRRREI
jgi:hypothetical protein